MKADITYNHSTHSLKNHLYSYPKATTCFYEGSTEALVYITHIEEQLVPLFHCPCRYPTTDTKRLENAVQIKLAQAQVVQIPLLAHS